MQTAVLKDEDQKFSNCKNNETQTEQLDVSVPFVSGAIVTYSKREILCPVFLSHKYFIRIMLFSILSYDCYTTIMMWQ
jgi:hypothetical protein